MNKVTKLFPMFLICFLTIIFAAEGSAKVKEIPLKPLPEQLAGAIRTNDADLMRMIQITNLDVIGYFKPAGLVSKQAVEAFKLTEDYKAKLEEINKLKKEMLESTYYFALDLKKNFDIVGGYLFYHEEIDNIIYQQFWLKWVDDKPINKHTFPLYVKDFNCINKLESPKYYMIYKVMSTKKLGEKKEVLLVDLNKVVMADSVTGTVCYQQLIKNKKKNKK